MYAYSPTVFRVKESIDIMWILILGQWLRSLREQLCDCLWCVVLMEQHPIVARDQHQVTEHSILDLPYRTCPSPPSEYPPPATKTVHN